MGFIKSISRVFGLTERMTVMELDAAVARVLRGAIAGDEHSVSLSGVLQKRVGLTIEVFKEVYRERGETGLSERNVLRVASREVHEPLSLLVYLDFLSRGFIDPTRVKDLQFALEQEDTVRIGEVHTASNAIQMEGRNILGPLTCQLRESESFHRKSLFLIGRWGSEAGGLNREETAKLLSEFQCLRDRQGAFSEIYQLDLEVTEFKTQDHEKYVPCRVTPLRWETAQEKADEFREGWERDQSKGSTQSEVASLVKSLTQAARPATFGAAPPAPHQPAVRRATRDAYDEMLREFERSTHIDFKIVPVPVREVDGRPGEPSLYVALYPPTPHLPLFALFLQHHFANIPLTPQGAFTLL
ncbi:MAG: hypothetical protein HYY93_15305, partial [Planctomycetes bacterium]|nr:hypothetical protein [Planctomycetota bacterium]